MVSETNAKSQMATMIDNSQPEKQPEDTPATFIPDGGPEEETRFLKSDALPGQAEASSRIGPFKIRSKLGQGGMGVVYEAYDENLDRRIAVKVISDLLAGTEIARDRLKVEAQSAARLNHPNIVSVYAFGEDRKMTYIAFEFVEGEDLGGIIRAEGALPLGRALSFVKQTAEALRFAWANHVIHRDIKPANLMVTRDGQIKVADFGLAKRMDMDMGLTSTDMILGSPNYMAPEQSSGGHVDFRTDIYSLGCTFYMMVTGDAPYKSSTPFGVLLMHSQEPLPQPDSVKQLLGGRVLRMIHRMMAKRAEDRFTSYDELLASIQELVDLESGAHSPTIVSKAPPPPKVPSTLIGRSTIALPALPAREISKMWVFLAIGAVIIFAVFVAMTIGPWNSRAKTVAPQPPNDPATAAASISAAGAGEQSMAGTGRPALEVIDRLADRATFLARAVALGRDIDGGQWAHALTGIEFASQNANETADNLQAIARVKEAIVIARDRELALIEEASQLVPFMMTTEEGKSVTVTKVGREGISYSLNGSPDQSISMASVSAGMRGRIAEYTISKIPATGPEEHFANILLLNAIGSPSDRQGWETSFEASPRAQEWKAMWKDWSRVIEVGKAHGGGELPRPGRTRPGGLPPPRRR